MKDAENVERADAQFMLVAWPSRVPYPGRVCVVRGLPTTARKEQNIRLGQPALTEMRGISG